MRNRPRTVWALIREIVRSDAVAKAQNKLHDAMQADADANGDFHVASTMYVYYSGVVGGIDPSTEWWAYAEAKQKLHDYEEQMEVYSARVDSAAELVKARLETYANLRIAQP